jgi:hypothetical protein
VEGFGSGWKPGQGEEEKPEPCGGLETRAREGRETGAVIRLGADMVKTKRRERRRKSGRE